jgi:Beta-lactamase enzyme family
MTYAIPLATRPRRAPRSTQLEWASSLATAGVSLVAIWDFFPSLANYNQRAVRVLTVVVLCLALLLAAPPIAQGEPRSWSARKAAAIDFAQDRRGAESFAFVDRRGVLWGYRKWRVAPSASLLKAMLLVSYLRRADTRARALTDSERALLGPMIRRSDNYTAGVVLGRVGERRLNALARRVPMRHFRLRSPWGLSEVTAGDQARFFYRIDRYVPVRHRPYARRLLSSIVSSQRWGIPPERPPGWKIFFKGGWGSGTGRVTHQSALLENGAQRISIAVLTEWNPSHAYGARTIRGIAARLLQTPLPQPAAGLPE